MIAIICAKYKKNPSRTVDATERTRFSKSRPNDLEDIGQGQRSSHATHPLMLLIICTKHGKNPSWTVDATGRTRKGNRQTDGQTDRQTGWIQSEIPYWHCLTVSRLSREYAMYSFKDKWVNVNYVLIIRSPCITKNTLNSCSMVHVGISGVAMRNVFGAENEKYKLGEIRFLLKRDVSECIWCKSGRWTEMAFDNIAIKGHF